MGKEFKIALAVAALARAASATACAAANRSHASNTLVFGAASDPANLDGALVSDGESLRVITQLFEGLVALKPGTTKVAPHLATSWKSSKKGKTWTFNLRSGVKFHDGTAFNAKAVCFNFNRWYNFTGPLQSPSVSYYWQTVFGGFEQNEPGSPTSSLYKACKANGAAKVTINLKKPTGRVPQRAVAGLVRDPEPDRAEEVRRRSRSVAAGWRVPSRPAPTRPRIRPAPGRSSSSRGRLGTSSCSSATTRTGARRRS